MDACITWGCAWKGTSFVGKDSAGRKMQTGAGVKGCNYYVGLERCEPVLADIRVLQLQIQFQQCCFRSISKLQLVEGQTASMQGF